MILTNGLNIATQHGPPLSKREAWVYFIHGQSNAFGNSLNSNLVAPFNTVIPNAYIYYKLVSTTDDNTTYSTDNGYWAPLSTAHNQLTDYLGTFYGPELRFAWELQNYWKSIGLERDLFIVKFAIGDTALNSENTAGVAGAGGLLDWAPGSTNELFKKATQDFWLAAKAKLEAMGRIPVSKGGLWMQGERDAFFSGFASAYNSNLQTLLAAFRTAYGNSSMHWAIGRIGNGSGITSRPYYATIRSAQAAVGALTNNSWFSTDSYTLQADQVHYADHGQLGYDFFLKVKDL